MRHDFLDRYSRSNSSIHRLPAWGKLTAALVLIVLIIVCPQDRWLLLAVPTAVLVAVAGLSRVPPMFLLKRLLFLELFVLGVAVMALLGPGGWRMMLILVVRCTLCLLTMILLSNTTPFAELLRVLQRVRVPALMITTLALMYRYLFVLVDEAQRMKRARTSRTFTAGRSWQWRTLATIISQLFVRASERAERVYAAMCARGWQ